MPKASPIQTSFNAGEFSPAMEGRVDLDRKYPSACKQLIGFVPMIQGPARRRSGTRFVSEVKYSWERTWLVRFEFAETDAYILEFGDLYIRFYTNHGQVLSGGIPYEISTPYTAADLVNANGTLALRMVQSGDVIYLVHPEFAPRKLSRFGPTNWTLTEVEFKAGPFLDIDPDTTTTVYASANTGSVTITASSGIFAATDVGSLFLIEEEDLSYIKPWASGQELSVGDGSPGVNVLNILRRSDGKTYKCVTNDFAPAASPAKVIRTGGDRPVHTSGVAADGDGEPLQPDNSDPTVYRQGVDWEFLDPGYGWVEITGFSSATQVTATVLSRLPDGVIDSSPGATKTVTAMAINTLGETRITATGHGLTANTFVTATLDYFDSVPVSQTLSGSFYAHVVDANTLDLAVTFPADYDTFDTGSITIAGTTGGTTNRWAFGRWSETRGWPDNVAFYRERLVFSTGQILNFSVAGDFENFAAKNDSGEVAADQAITIEIASDTVNDVLWMMPSDGLLLGTAGGEFVCSELTTDEVFGPGNVKIAQQSTYGSRSVMPLQIGEGVVFVQRAGRKLREMQYEFASDGFKSVDLSVFAEHITYSGISDIVYQQEPHSIIWCSLNNGNLVGFTFNREQDVLGWHRHPIGGDGIVECMEVIPNPDGSQDDLWMIVRRTINGQTKRYIEYLEQDFTDESDIEDAFFVDSGLTYDGAPATTISGLGHLEGEEVAILVDGATHPLRTVTSGSVTLQRAGSKVQIGLPFQTLLQTLRLEAGAADGTAQGKTKRITKVVVRFLATVGAQAGVNPADLDEIQFRSPSVPMDQAVPPFTGDKMVEWPGSYDFDGYMYISQPQPLPMTIVALMPQVITQDR